MSALDPPGQQRRQPPDPVRGGHRSRPQDAAAGRAPLPGEVGLLRAWIDQGAVWPDAASAEVEDPAETHWAFRPVSRPAVPTTRGPRSAIRNPDRRIRRGEARPERPRDVPGSRPAHAGEAALPRAPRTAADARGGRRLRRRRSARRLRRARGSAARLAALRRALGAALARRRRVRRDARVRGEHPARERLAVPRLRHPRLQRRQALSRIHPGPAGRRRDGRGRRHRLPRRQGRAAAGPDRARPRVHPAREAGRTERHGAQRRRRRSSASPSTAPAATTTSSTPSRSAITTR